MEQPWIETPEATFSLTLTGTVGGIAARLTVRGMTADELRTHLAQVTDLLDAPAPPTSQPFHTVGPGRTSPPPAQAPPCPTKA